MEQNMRKIFLLVAILFISGCGSLFSSVFVEKHQKEQEVKRTEKEKQQQMIEDLKKEQAQREEAEKQARVQYLISLYDKGLNKNLSEKDIDDLDEMIEDIKKADKTKADNINMFMCNEIGNFNACFRTLEYYMANDSRKKADEIYNKLHSWCLEGYHTACDYIGLLTTLEIKNNGKYSLYKDNKIKSNIILDKNYNSIQLEIVDMSHKIIIPFIREGKWDADSVTCFTLIEYAGKSKSKKEEYITDSCVLYPSFDGTYMPFNRGNPTRSAIKIKNNDVIIEIPQHYISTEAGALTYNGYDIVIKKDIINKIYNEIGKYIKNDINFKSNNYFNK